MVKQQNHTIHQKRARNVLYAMGETLPQLGIIVLVTFILERIKIFQVLLISWNPNILWWEAEIGLILLLNLIVSLTITNILFIFIKGHWLYRAILESFTFTGIYFIISFFFEGIATFGYSNIYIFLGILFFSVIGGNLISNKFIYHK